MSEIELRNKVDTTNKAHFVLMNCANFTNQKCFACSICDFKEICADISNE